MSTENFLSDVKNLAEQQENLARLSQRILAQSQDLAQELASNAAGGGGHDFFIVGLTVFVLACFVGYYVVWRVTPALHSPLMAVTNAVSSVIIVGALIAAGAETMGASSWLGLLATALAAVNIFGGFIVTQRMLHMYKKKQ